MMYDEIPTQLATAMEYRDFSVRLRELVNEWSVRNMSVDVVTPILQFLEDHPKIDLGMPGPLVHYAETFLSRGYEERLIESLNRRPTLYTVWMLNRLINGTDNPDTRTKYIHALRMSMNNPLADEDTRNRIQHFLQRLNSNL